MKGSMDCPYHSAVEVVGTQNERLKYYGLGEEEIKKAPVVGQRGAPQLHVSKEAMISTLKMDVEYMLEELEGHLPEIPRPVVAEITGHSLRRSGAKDAVRRHQMPLAMVQWLGRWGSEAVRGYVEEAMEEMPETELQLISWQGLTERALKMNSRQQKLEDMVKDLKASTEEEQEVIKGMLEELKRSSKPPMVVNRATLMLHATAPSNSSEWLGNPVLWTTRCGLWRWGVAGRIAKTLTSSEQTRDEYSACTKCRTILISEGWLLE